jgi:ribonucleoside-diphosphate reductase alpha chain
LPKLSPKFIKVIDMHTNEQINEELEKKNEILEGQTTSLPFSLNALQVISKRYLVRDEEGNITENPEQMYERVSQALAKVELKYGKSQEYIQSLKNEFWQTMTNLEFTPAGRTLANAGGPTRLVSNCIVLNVEDSMDSIFQTLKEASLLQQAGSGLGFPLHLLRPAGYSTIKSRGQASGPISFLRVYNAAFGVIKQQNRHGANMGIMTVNHPDILEFIHCKEDEHAIQNFNISVGLTNRFMEQVKNNSSEPWFCEWQGQQLKPRRIKRNSNFSYLEHQDVDMTARQLFEEIIECAWKNGEPGCVFLDKVNETNPVPGLGRIEACNPCVVGDSLVNTDNGLMKMSRLVDQFESKNIKVSTDNRLPIEILHSNGLKSLLFQNQKLGTTLQSVSNVWKRGEKEIILVETEGGYSVKVTPDHKIMTTDGWIQAKHLTKEHKVLIQSGEGEFGKDNNLPFKVQNEYSAKNGRKYVYNFPLTWSKELGQVLGYLIGDGWIRDKPGEYMVGFTFGETDFEILQYIKSVVNRWYGNETKEIKRVRNTYHLNYNAKSFVNFIKNFGLNPVKAEDKTVPETILMAPRNTVIGFLQGLFTADGTVGLDNNKGNYYVRLTSKSMHLLACVQNLLLNLGMKSRIYDRSRPARAETFAYLNKNGEQKKYGTDGILYELQLSKESCKIFIDKIGFIGQKNCKKLVILKKIKFHKEEWTDKVKKVQCVGRQEVFDLTEPLTHSFICNSIIVSNCGEQFLHDGDVCNLGSINLEKFVVDGKIDYVKLSKVTKLAVRMLDNVIDLSDFPVQKVNNTFRGNRRIGLGIMGFADMLYKMRVPYNSQEGRDTAEKVMGCIQRSAHEMSSALAEEKGVFPNWDKSVYAQRGIKMRNAALTNVAPTGTISMVMDVSGGVEPYFALAYHYKNILGGKTELYYTNKHLRAELERLGLYNDETMERITQEGSLQKIAEIPKETKNIFVTAMDISAEDHTRMQAAFQKHIDNAISKTINFTNDATREDVLQGYILAWELGCKGCTVYRDGSRNEQILNLNKDKKKVPTEEKSKGLESVPEIIISNNGTITTNTTITNGTSKHDVIHSGKCPECSSQVQVSEGCYTCISCGFSACSL